MRKSGTMLRLVLACFVFVAASGWAAAETPPVAQLQSLLTPDEFRAAGLEKLTPAEISALEAALIKHHALPKPKKTKSTATSVSAAPTPTTKAADDFGAENPPAFWLGDDLHITVVRIHQDGFSVVVERITRDKVLHAFLIELALKPPLLKDKLLLRRAQCVAFRGDSGECPEAFPIAALE